MTKQSYIKTTGIILCLALVCILALAAVSVFATTPKDTAYAAWSGSGNGTASNPYIIDTAAKLRKFRDIVNGSNGETQKSNACAKLTADINLGCTESNPWEPIGKYSTNTNQTYCNATFDGNGHTVSGIYVKGTNLPSNAQAGTAVAGFFGKCRGVTIKDLTIANSTFTGKKNGEEGNIGAIAGEFDDYAYVGESSLERIEGIMQNCHVAADVTVTVYDNTFDYDSDLFLGGLIGRVFLSNANSRIEMCSNSAHVYCGDGAGGIVGTIDTSSDYYTFTISNCCNFGTLEYGGDLNTCVYRVGGIVGKSKNTLIQNCFNSGYIKATNKRASFELGHQTMGGIAGYFEKSNILNCYNTGTIEYFNCSRTSSKIGYGCGIAMDSGEDGKNITTTIKYCHNYGVVKFYVYNNSTLEGIYENGVPAYENKVSSSLSRNYYLKENTKLVLDSDDPDNPQNERIYWLETAEAYRTQESYVDWDFENVWIMGDNYPVLRALSYNIVFHPNYTGASNVTKKVEYKGKVASLLPSRAGYTLVGWYTNSALTNAFNFNTPITANMELYAKWQETEYSIHYAMNDGVNSNNNPDSYKMSTLPITLKNPFRGTYEFLGWTMNGVDTPTKDLTIPAGTTGDLTITANWTKIYTITYALNDGENDGNNPTNYTELTPTIILADPSKVGYVFSGWTTTGITTPTKGLTIEQGSSGNKTFIANWSAINYTITYLNAENGTNGVTNTNPTSYTIETAMFTLTDPSRTGYSFDGWTENDTTITQGSTGNKTFTANWDINIYLITYTNAENGENGVTNTNPKTYTVEDENFTLVAPSRTGYQFLGWDENDVTIEQGSTGDKTFTANWTQTYAITYLNATVGLDRVTSNNNPDVYTVLEDVVLNDPVRTGYTFNGWTENSEPITQITAGSTGDKTLTANWTMDIYQITYANLFDSTNPNAGTTSYTVESAEIVLADPSRTGYTFEGWTEGNMIAAGSTGNKTFTANWTLVKPTLSMDGYSHVYDGISHSITVTPTHALAVEYSYQWKKGDDIIVGATTATISVKDVLDSATYTVTVTASINGDHSLQEKSAFVSITPKALFITANDTTITYGDAPANDGVTYNGFENNETKSVLGGTLGFTYSYAQFGNKGTYSITPKDLTSNNYAITFNNGTLTVEPKPITVTIDSKTSTYGEAPVLLTATNEPGAIVNNDSNVYSLATVVTSASPVNTYDITGTELNHNYAITFENGTNAYTVTVRSITIGWTHTDDLVYNKTAQKPTATAGNLKNNDVVALTVSGEQTNAGTGYLATASFAAAQTNYVLPAVVTTTFAIAEKPITVTIVGKTSVYGDAQVELTATIEQGAIEDGDADPYTLNCEVDETSAVGHYDIIGTDTSTNYAVTFANRQNAYSVTQKALTVTAKAKAITYGDAPANDGVVYDGFVNGQDENVLTGTLDYDYTYTQYEHVSDDTHAYSITPKGYDLSNGNYQILYVAGVQTVEPKNIIVTIDNKESVYGENPVELTATDIGIVNGDQNVYSLACDVTAVSPVGTYDITGADTSDNYVVSFANEENAYSVTPRTITIAWTHIDDLVYNKSAQKPTATAGNLVNDDEVTMTVAGEKTNAGTGYLATASFAAAQTNYVLPDVVTTNFAIAEKPITVTIVNKTSVYGEAQVALTATTEQGAIEDGDTDPFALTCAVTAASNVGFYDIIGTDTSTNYDVSFVGESDAYEVTVRTITIAWSHTNDLVYNKTAQKPTATAGNLVNNDNVALTVSGEQTNAGTGYEATASFVAAQTNYVLPAVVTATFAIAEKPITVTIVGKTSVYGEAQVALTATTEQGAIEDGDQNVYSLACEVTATSDVGSYDITGTDTSDNYAVSFLNEDNAYSVTQKALTVTAKAKTITYGDAPANDGVTYEGFVNGQDESVLTGTLDYDYTYSQYGHVSDETHAYGITPKGYDLSNGNYALAFVPATLTVEPKQITVMITAKESVYGENPVELTATDNGIVNGDENVYSLACDVTAASPVGTYDITGTDTSDNYVVSFANESNAYSVTPRTITISWAHTNDLVYNKSAQKPTATAENLKNDDVVALTVSGEQTNAGTGYLATAAFAAAQTNYVLPDVVTTNFAIAEKPITVTIIGKTSVYGEAQVALTATTEQGAIEDGDADPYALECEVTSASNVGVYDIIGTDTSTNYAVTFANEEGAYAVTKKTLTVTVDDKSIKYAEDVPEFTLVVTGVVDGNDDPSEIKSTILENSTMTSTAVDGNTSGKYAISFAFDEGENEDTVLDDYTIEYTNGVLTIAKRLGNGGIRAEGLDPDKDYEIKRDDEDGDNDNEKDVGIKITIKNDPDNDDNDEDYTGEAELIIDVPEPIDPEHFDLYKEDENGETPVDPDDYDVEEGQIIIETKLPVKFILKNRKGQIYVQVNDASIHDGDDIPTYSYTVTGWEQQGGGLTADEENAAKNAVQALATSYTVGQTGQFDIDPSFKTGYTEYTVVDGFRVRLTGGILSVLPKILRDKTVEVSLENEEDAFDLDISVEVEIKTTMEAKEEEGIDYDAVSAKFVDRRSEISAVYSVKLLRTETVNGVETITEIQPSDIKPGSDTTIIVKMEIPEHLTGRSFRILHIHSANDIEYVDKSQIEIKDGYVYAKVNRLSEFAFVNLKDAEEMDHHGFCLGWLVVIFDILVAVYFAVYMLLKRKKLLNIIGLGVSGAVLVFALIVLILHICIVSIIGFVLAVLLFAAFLTFFFIDKKGDDSKQKCDKTQKIESKKENAQGNVATTTTTQTVIETDNEATAVVPVAVIEESEDEEEEGEDGGVVVDASGNIFNIRYKKSFLAKLIQSPDVTKQYYTALKNEVLAYNKTKSRVSWAYDSVNAGRTQLLKFSVRGKTLCVYFALNADDYIDSKYKVEKAEAAKYESVSCMYRIKNDRRAKYAIDLIATVCAKYGLTKGEVPTEDYYLPYETTEALIGKGLIKELKTVATDEQVKRAKAAGKIKYVSHVSVSEANEMISDEVAATLIEEKRIGSAVGKKDIVNVDVLSKNYNDGDTVTIDNLKTKKLVPQSAKQVKLLARGTLDKKLHIELQDYSIEAVKMVIATGGTVKRV